MNTEKYKALISLRDDLIKKIEPTLALQLKIVNDLIEAETQKTIRADKSDKITEKVINLFSDSTVSPNGKILKPVQAIKRLFKDNPTKAFKPTELRDYLQGLKNSGKLEHKGSSILTTTHTVIRGLKKQNLIEAKDEGDGETKYALK